MTRSPEECVAATKAFAVSHGLIADVVVKSGISPRYLDAISLTLTNGFFFDLCSDDDDDDDIEVTKAADEFNTMVQSVLGAKCFKFDCQPNTIDILF